MRLTDAKKKELTKCYRIVKELIPQENTSIRVVDCVTAICSKLALAPEIEANAAHVA